MSFILNIYADVRTVYRLKDIALLLGEDNFVLLNKKLNYYVKTGKLLNPRKGIYCKPKYNTEELACKLFAPSYISLEYVLQRAGVIFQYDSRITMISYLSREIEIDDFTVSFRKIKNELLIATQGLVQKENTVTIACSERAFLDIIYLNGETYFDNLKPLNKEKICKLMPLYGSQILIKRVNKIFKND